jgi:hypothetical protein
MFRLRTLVAVSLFVPFLAAPLPAEAAKDIRAARAECFRQANEAAGLAAGGFGSPAAQTERQAAGMDAYHVLPQGGHSAVSTWPSCVLKDRPARSFDRSPGRDPCSLAGIAYCRTSQVPFEVPIPHSRKQSTT